MPFSAFTNDPSNVSTCFGSFLTSATASIYYYFISSLVKAYQSNILLFENTNFIRLRGKDMTSLLKLLGSLEVMEIKKVKSIPVDKVKRMVKELLSKELKKLKELVIKKVEAKDGCIKIKELVFIV